MKHDENIIGICNDILDYEKKTNFDHTKPKTINWSDKRKGLVANTVYIPECSSLGDTVIQLGDTYENSLEDCLYIEKVLHLAPLLAKYILGDKE